MFTGAHVGIPVSIVATAVGIAHRRYGNDELRGNISYYVIFIIASYCT